MFNVFKKFKKEKLFSPMTGKVIDVTEVPDQVFSQKILGEGIAIDPTDQVVVSPCDGVITQIFPSKHAITIKTKLGLDFLIHVGIDTVQLEGKGFETFVEKGDAVKAGDKLIEVDLEYIKEHAKSSITPLVLAEMSQVKSVNKLYKEGGAVVAGQDLLMKVSLN